MVERVGSEYMGSAGAVSITDSYAPLTYIGKSSIVGDTNGAGVDNPGDGWTNTNFNGGTGLGLSTGFIGVVDTGGLATVQAAPVDNLGNVPYGADGETPTVFWPLTDSGANSWYGRDQTGTDATGNPIFHRFVRNSQTFAQLDEDMDAWFFRSATARSDADLEALGRGNVGKQLFNSAGVKIFDSRELYTKYTDTFLNVNLGISEAEHNSVVQVGSTITQWRAILSTASRAVLDNSGKLGITMPTISAGWHLGLIWDTQIITLTQADVDGGFGSPGVAGDKLLIINRWNGTGTGDFDVPEMNPSQLQNINISIIDATDLP